MAWLGRVGWNARDAAGSPPNARAREQTGLTQIAAPPRQETVQGRSVLAVGERRMPHPPGCSSGVGWRLIGRTTGLSGCRVCRCCSVHWATRAASRLLPSPWMRSLARSTSGAKKPDAADGQRATEGDGPTHPPAQAQPSITAWPWIPPGRRDPGTQRTSGAPCGWRLNDNRMEPGGFRRTRLGRTWFPRRLSAGLDGWHAYSGVSVTRVPLVGHEKPPQKPLDHH